jgi:hypothetical protein
VTTWIIWAVILILQNAAFTLVSRARNSGSMSRHVGAALLSNGVWFLSQGIIFTKLYKIMTGEYGWQQAVLTGLFYTTFTIVGSVAAHYIALRTEKGKSAVGASSKYAQISKEEWQLVYHLCRDIDGYRRGVNEGLLPKPEPNGFVPLQVIGVKA